MGIRGLQSLLKNAGWLPRVNVEDLIKEFKIKTGAKDIIAIVDGTNFLNYMFLSQRVEFCGGNYKFFINHLDLYVKRLTDLGIKPIFIFGQYGSDDKVRWAAARIYRSQKTVTDFYRMLESSKLMQFRQNDQVAIPNLMFQAAVAYLKEQKIEVHLFWEDADVEISRFAIEKEACFIFSDDTSFVRFNCGKAYHVSQACRHLRLPNMSTVLFDKEKVAHFMGLDVPSLPLLGAVTNSEWLCDVLLRGLHIKLAEFKNPLSRFDCDDFYIKNFHIILPKLITYIREELVNSRDVVKTIQDSALNGYPRWKLRTFAEKILGKNKNEQDLKKAIGEQVSLALVKFGYNGRNFNAENCLLPVEDRKYEETIFSGEFLTHIIERLGIQIAESLLPILRRRIHPMLSAYENPNLPIEFQSSYALRPMRARLYGLIFNRTNVAVTQWSVYASDFIEVDIEPVHPEFDFPRFEELMEFVDEGNIDQEIRWKLFVWGLGGPSSAAEKFGAVLRNIPEYFVAPVAALYMMYNAKLLDGFEYSPRELVLMFLKTFPLSKNSSNSVMDDVDFLKVIEPDAVHLSAVLMSCCTHIYLLNQVIGTLIPCSQLNPAKYFAGTIFQKLYQKEDDDLLTENQDHDLTFLVGNIV